MAPIRKKRKSETAADDGGVKLAPKKKSKRERLAEARAKAKAWHDSRNAGGAMGAGAAKLSPRPSSSGKLSAQESRWRNPSCETDGGSGAIRGAAPASRRGRASAGGVATFKFAPPVKEENFSDEEAYDEEEEEEEEEKQPRLDTRDASVQAVGPASKNSFGRRSTPDYYFSAGASSKKRKEWEGSGATTEMHIDRERLGMMTAGGQHPSDRNQKPRRRGHVRELLQRDRLALPPDDGEMKAPLEVIKSPDPPAAVVPTTAAAEEDLPSTANSKSLVLTPAAAMKPKPKSRRASSIPPPTATAAAAARTVPPPSVRSTFAAPKLRTSAHRSDGRKFDPDEPRPPPGYKRPTAAYGGCGPAPSWMRASSVRGARGVFRAVDGVSDLRSANSAAGVPSANARLKSPVDPPCEMYSGGSGDERNFRARPSPPGRDADGIEVGDGGSRDATAADDGGDSNARNEGGRGWGAASSAVAATAPPATAEVNNAGALRAAFSRAKAPPRLTAAPNRRRRAKMGIRSPGDDREAIDSRSVDASASARTAGMPPRDVARMERPADAVLAAGRSKEGEKMQLDPPGCPPPLAVPQQKFREARSDRASFEGKVEERSDGNSAMQLTNVGEATSDVRGNVAGRIILAKDDDSLSHKKKSSFLKRGCLALMKCVMFAQMAFGIFYLMTNYSPHKKLRDISIVFGGKWKEPKPATTPWEDSFTCFFDYPALDRDSSDNEEGVSIADGACKGDYKQCPPRGRCKGRVLVSCNDGDNIYEGTKPGGTKNLKLFVPNDNGRECVMSNEATELVAAVKNTLVNMTVAQTCGSSNKNEEASSVFLMEGNEFPLFSSTKVAEKMNEVHEEYDAAWTMSSDLLLWLSPAFDSDLVRFVSLPGDDGNDLDAVGLGTSVHPNSLALPFECGMKLLLGEALEFIGNCFLALMLFSMKNIWILVTAHPFYALCFAAIWKLAGIVRSKLLAIVLMLYAISRLLPGRFGLPGLIYSMLKALLTKPFA